MPLPTLQTERLTLRWFEPGDEDVLLAVWNDPEFVRHVGDRGIRTTEQASKALAGGILKLYEQHGYGPYHVALSETGEAMGICGLFKREYLDDPDIGFAFLPDYRGKGYAREAAVAVLDHARNGLGLSRVAATVSPGNATSIALIEKLGLRFDGTIKIPPENRETELYLIDWAQKRRL